MGGRLNRDRYGAADWRAKGETVGRIISNGWLVYTECEVCQLRIEADLRRIARERGPKYSLWGRWSQCRRMGCPGRVTFWCRPPGGFGDIAMTAAPRR